MEIKQVNLITNEILLAFQNLISQLSENSKPTVEDLIEVISSKNSFLFIAEENEEIIGTLTLVTYRIPTGKKAWIEDVVVDNTKRGKGIGRNLIQHVITYASSIGIAKIDLTSSFSRVEANELYQKMGFKKRDTNVYRMEIKN